MSDDRFQALSDDQLDLIDTACSQLEDSWQSDQPITIEQQCAEADPVVHPYLLRELLAAEIEARRSHGELPLPADYESRFPDQTESIAQAFGFTSDTDPTLEMTQTVAYGSTSQVLRRNEANWRASPISDSTSRSSWAEFLPMQFGRYRLQRLLGRGGMGSVYLAHDQELDRDVAIKFPEFDDRSDVKAVAIERFRREARAMATVQHPHLCSVFDVGELEGRHYLTMAYVDGQSLSEFAENLSPLDIVRVVATVARALEAAHQAGIVHRDLKPSNVMLNAQGEPIVMDFGLASRDAVQESAITHTGLVIGSPAYMAPEQVEADHERIGPQTDVYALGVILYQLLTGRRPFDGSGLSVLGQISSGRQPTAPSTLADVDSRLESICLKAMAFRIEDRFQSAVALAEALESTQRQPETTRATGQLRTLHVVAGVVSVAVAAFVVATWFPRDQPLPVNVTSSNVTPTTTTERPEVLANLDNLPTISDPTILRSDFPLVKIFKGGGGAVTALAFSGNGKMILSGHADGEIHFWDVQSSTAIHSVTGLLRVSSLSISPDGQFVAIGTSGKGILIYRLSDAVQTNTLSKEQLHVTALDWSLDGQWLLASDYSGTTVVWNVEQDVEFKRLRENYGHVQTATFSRDGRTAIVASNTGGVSVWSVPEWNLRREIPVTSPFAAISHSGTRVVVGNKVFDTEDVVLKPLFDTRGRYPTDLEFTRDGRYILACSYKQLEIRDAKSGITVGTVQSEDATMKEMVTSPDGRYVVTGGGEAFNSQTKRIEKSGDNLLRLWRLPASVVAVPSSVSTARASGLLPPHPVPTRPSTGHFMDSGQELGNSSAYAVVAGDVDGDGDVDMLVANGQPHQPDRVWLNDGHGRFSVGQELDRQRSWDVQLGDLDSDGDLDAFVACQESPSVIWRNNGKGRFEKFGETKPLSCRGLALGDLDGDGDLDAVLSGDSGSPQNRVLINDGAARFHDSGQRLGTAETLGIALADLDGDGDLDTFAANWKTGNVIWLNDGRGSFTDSDQRLGTDPAIHVALADIDHDGDTDACVTCKLVPSRLWMNDGSGRFSATDLTASERPALGVAIADFNGDGRNDVLIGNGDLGGDRPMFPNQTFLSTGDLSWNNHWLGAEATADFGIADLDGDGDLDAFLANGFDMPNRVWLNRNLDERETGPVRFYDSGQALGNATSNEVELGDVDGDGDLDAVVANINGEANTVWINDGSGRFAVGQRLLDPPKAFDVGLGDLDGDNDLDVFLTNKEGSNRVWLNDSKGNFEPVGQQLGHAASNQVALADFDKDGDLDAWIGNFNPDHDSLWINDGQGQFKDSGQRLGVERNYAVHPVDVDNDGDLDVFTGTASDGVNSLWLNDGQGRFARSDQKLSGTVASNGFAVGDLNGDGFPDCYETGWMAPDRMWLNDGKGKFIQARQVGQWMKSRRAQLADLDSDGDIDVFVGNENFLPNSVWLNDGTGRLTVVHQWLGNSSTTGLALGDLDSDGDIDAFVTNARNQPNRVWLNDTTAGIPTGNIEPVKSSLSAADLLATGRYEWRVEKNLGRPVNSQQYDASATMTTDLCTIVLSSSRREGNASRMSLWILSRESIDAQWSNLENLSEKFELEQESFCPNISQDGLSLAFIARGQGQKGQIYITRRDSATSEWSAPVLHQANSKSRHQHSMSFTPDGLSMVVTMSLGTGSNYDLFVSHRASLTELWSTPLPIGSPVNTDQIETNGTLSNDGRVLILVRASNAPDPKSDLWIATRNDRTAPWSVPVPMDSLNTEQIENAPKLLANGRTLLFSSNRPGGNGSNDIYLARLVRCTNSPTAANGEVRNAPSE